MSLDAEETEILRELEAVGARRLAERLVTMRRRGGKMRPPPWSLVRMLPDGGALIRQARSSIGAVAERVDALSRAINAAGYSVRDFAAVAEALESPTDDLVWRVGYYEGVTWRMWSDGYAKQSPDHGNGARDPNWRWTMLYREIQTIPPIFDTLDALFVGVPGGIVWACIQGPRPRLTDPPSLVERNLP